MQARQMLQWQEATSHLLSRLPKQERTSQEQAEEQAWNIREYTREIKHNNDKTNDTFSQIAPFPTMQTPKTNKLCDTYTEPYPGTTREWWRIVKYAKLSQELTTHITGNNRE